VSPPAKRESTRPSQQFQNDLVALIPFLRAFSRVLCGGKAIAEDMAQEALAKAWRSHGSFEPGTNLKAWLFTILRNEFYTHGRRAWREAHWDQEKAEQIGTPDDPQEWVVHLSDTTRALATLPVGQREALLLVAAGGFSYEDTATICGAPMGTIKSRVARARTALLDILDNGKPLPRRPSTQMAAGSRDILAQLSALTPAGGLEMANPAHAAAA
jgi:RNA polymerase sigma-70 factor (ECF subfamily)